MQWGIAGQNFTSCQILFDGTQYTSETISMKFFPSKGIVSKDNYVGFYL